MVTPPAGNAALAAIFAAVEVGRFPDRAAALTVLRSPASSRDHGVFAFTGHNVVAADIDPAWVRSRVPTGDVSAPMSVAFLAGLAAATGRRVPIIDAVLTAPACPQAADGWLREVTDSDHPRVRRARRHREDIRVWTTVDDQRSGVVVLGRGVGGRLEMAFEVEPAARGRGLGRTLVRAARQLAPAGSTVWAQVSSGNAASVRALLAGGFVPVGSEALLTP